MTSNSTAITVAPLRKPPTMDAIQEYFSTRLVLEHKNTMLIVDGFRYSALYLSHMTEKFLADDQSSALVGPSPPTKSFGGIFFLTHFHSDHYTGLHANWSHGVIITGCVTGALLSQQLGVPMTRISCLEEGRSYILSLTDRRIVSKTHDNSVSPVAIDYSLPVSCGEDEIEVTLLPANHCPGANMILFRHPVHGTILHTGDFRFNGTEMQWKARHVARTRYPVPRVSFLGDNHILKCVAGKVSKLFLDNTFCDPAFDFQPQEEAYTRVIRCVADCIVHQYERKFCQRSVVVSLGDEFDDVRGTSLVASECFCQRQQRLSQNCEEQHQSMENPSKKCIHIAALVGTYTIGKERMAIALREAFPTSKHGARLPIYVSKEKKALLNSTAFDDSWFRSCSNISDDSSIVGVLDPLTSPNTPADSQQQVVYEEHEIDLDCVDEWDAKPKLEFIRQDKVKVFLTLFLVPLQCMSYPYLASSMDETAGGGADAESLQRRSPPRTLFLWQHHHLPLDPFDAVVCIEPTGWAASKKFTQSKRIARKFELISVPYSEHSSFSELIHFVKFVQPAKVIPTVSLEQFKKQEPLFVEANQNMQSKYANVQPLSKFSHLFRKQTHPGELVDLDRGTKNSSIGDARLKVSHNANPKQEPVLFSNQTSHNRPASLHSDLNRTADADLSLASRKRMRGDDDVKMEPLVAPSSNTLIRGTSTSSTLVEKKELLLSVVSDDEDDVVFVSSTQVCIDVDEVIEV